jgi:hypothetical protein
MGAACGGGRAWCGRPAPVSAADDDYARPPGRPPAVRGPRSTAVILIEPPAASPTHPGELGAVRPGRARRARRPPLLRACARSRLRPAPALHAEPHPRRPWRDGGSLSAASRTHHATPCPHRHQGPRPHAVPAPISRPLGLGGGARRAPRPCPPGRAAHAARQRQGLPRGGEQSWDEVLQHGAARCHRVGRSAPSPVGLGGVGGRGWGGGASLRKSNVNTGAAKEHMVTRHLVWVQKRRFESSGSLRSGQSSFLGRRARGRARGRAARGPARGRGRARRRA